MGAAYLTPPSQGAVLHVMHDTPDSASFDIARLGQFSSLRSQALSNSRHADWYSRPLFSSSLGSSRTGSLTRQLERAGGTDRALPDVLSVLPFLSLTSSWEDVKFLNTLHLARCFRQLERLLVRNSTRDRFVFFPHAYMHPLFRPQALRSLTD